MALVEADAAPQRVVDLLDRTVPVADDQDVGHRRKNALDELLRVFEGSVLLLEHHLVLQEVVVDLVHLVDHLDPDRLTDFLKARLRIGDRLRSEQRASQWTRGRWFRLGHRPIGSGVPQLRRASGPFVRQVRSSASATVRRDASGRQRHDIPETGPKDNAAHALIVEPIVDGCNAPMKSRHKGFSATARRHAAGAAGDRLRADRGGKKLSSSAAKCKAATPERTGGNGLSFCFVRISSPGKVLVCSSCRMRCGVPDASGVKLPTGGRTTREGNHKMANSSLLQLEGDSRIAAASERLGMRRREFLQFCGSLAASLGLPPGADAAVAEAVASKKRQSVIWLRFQECTGCSESMLRAEHRTLEKLILDVISLDYHETLFAAAGHQAEQARKTAMAENKGGYVLVVEGAIPTRDSGSETESGGTQVLQLSAVDFEKVGMPGRHRSAAACSTPRSSSVACLWRSRRRSSSCVCSLA
ncbi:MAG: Hydrogenase-2 small chain precursor [Candidatus Accumulibacter sp. SK-11]|nr:MAG: Hydrogenase-2 small chain precursor [Candidatus Accumulibacter sp. SK-11]